MDVARVGGITPWLKVAHLAETFNVEVCPHFLMELHVSLAAAVPNGRLRRAHPAAARHHHDRDGGPWTATPSRRTAPGLGIDWDRDAMDDRRVA